MRKILLAAVLLGCSPSQMDVQTEALSVHNRCEQLAPGECYKGRWVGDCICTYNPRECANACGECYRAIWSPDACACVRDYMECP